MNRIKKGPAPAGLFSCTKKLCKYVKISCLPSCILINYMILYPQGDKKMLEVEEMFRPDKLNRLIVKEGMSRKEFAKKINMSPATVSRLLRGRIKPSSNMLEKLKATFPEYSMDYFFD